MCGCRFAVGVPVPAETTLFSSRGSTTTHRHWMSCVWVLQAKLGNTAASWVSDNWYCGHEVEGGIVLCGNDVAWKLYAASNARLLSKCPPSPGHMYRLHHAAPCPCPCSARTCAVAGLGLWVASRTSLSCDRHVLGVRHHHFHRLRRHPRISREPGGAGAWLHTNSDTQSRGAIKQDAPATYKLL